MQEKNNSDIMHKIKRYMIHIKRFRESLNIEGVWIFLATLGCWSVTNKYIQLYAMLTTVFIFSYRLKSKVKDMRPFSKIEDDITEMINTSSNEGELKSQQLEALDIAKKFRMSFKNAIKTPPIFIIFYIFFGVSLLHFMEVF